MEEIFKYFEISSNKISPVELFDILVFVVYNFIKSKIANIEFFPYQLNTGISENSDDITILEYQRKICNEYLQKYSQSDDDDTKLRVALLKQLMIYTYNDKTVFAQQLRKDLENIGYEVFDRKLKTELIGKLRSYGIIISGTKSGYCLATKKEHVANYIVMISFYTYHL